MVSSGTDNSAIVCGQPSIQHEDVMLTACKWLKQSVALPQNDLPVAPADLKPQDN